MNCPKCNGPCEELADEVDIGVGILRHVYGWDCPTCGQIAKCPNCGAPETEHAAWCRENKL
jgi:hypothetical protein